MSKGYMAKVAETLGVEIGEVFKISKENSNEKFTKYFRITHDNIEESEYQFLYSHWDTCNSEVLLRLLNGSLTLHKLFWKPKKRETYYCPNIFGKDLYNVSVWDDGIVDKEFYKRGLVFETKEEAIAMSRRMLAIAITEEREND